MVLTMLLAALMLAGCGNGTYADGKNDSNDNDVVENTDMDYEDDLPCIMVQWDTYACEDDNHWGIPKYGEE